MYESLFIFYRCYLTAHFTFTQNRRKEAIETLTKVVCVREEETCIPTPLLTIHEHLSKFSVWLFSKGLHLIYIAITSVDALLNISVSRFWSGRANPHRQYSIILLNER